MTKTKKPAPLASDIDDLFKAREKLRAAQKIADDIAAAVKVSEEALLVRMRSEKLTQAAGKLGTVSVSESEEPTVEPEGWPKVWAFIKKHDAFELVQKRLSAPAWRERRENGVLIPGTAPFVVVKLKLRSK